MVHFNSGLRLNYYCFIIGRDKQNWMWKGRRGNDLKHKMSDMRKGEVGNTFGSG